MKPDYKEKERWIRTLLYHRFDLLGKTTEIEGEVYSIQNLPFENAVRELQRTYALFIESEDLQEKIIYLISQTFLKRHQRIIEKECVQLLDTISNTLLNFNQENHFGNIEDIDKIDNADDIEEKLKKRSLVIIPLKTLSEEGTEHIKTIAMFDERLLKVNHKQSKKPGIRIYRVQYAPTSELMQLIHMYLNSFKKPLDSNWDKELNALLHPEKINLISKKEQKVGNESWLTAKMLIMVIAYAVLFEYCKEKGLKELEAESISVHIAEGLYKFFIVFDRNLAVREYLERHGFPESDEMLSVTHRVESIKTFLSSRGKKRIPVDKDMLLGIYIKSLNWLLADYLKKGDIGQAHALLESEISNQRWNPLIYAAKNGKIAIAELLGSNSRYMNLRDKLGNLPIHYAVSNGYLDICTVFLHYQKKNKLDLTEKNQYGNTPLHLAALHNRIDIIDLLFKQDSRLLNLLNTAGETALKLACDYQHMGAIKKLIELGSSVEGIDPAHYSEEIQTQLKKRGRSTLL